MRNRADQRCRREDGADNPIWRQGRCVPEVTRSNLDLRRDAGRVVVLWKKNHQRASDFPCLGERTATAGQFRDKPRQLLGCFVAAERRQSVGLFPGIETELHESRNDTQRSSFDFVANGRK